MLLAFGAKNFCCFKEWMEIDFRLNNNVPVEISQGRKAATLMCLKGANASGKTNAIKTLAFLKEFCTNSFNYKPEQQIGINTFFDNDQSSEFYVDFLIDNIEYTYELMLNKKKIISESIQKKENRQTPLFIRSENIVIKNDLYKAKEISLRSNASIISTLYQYEVTDINKIYYFFSSIISNVGHSGLIPDFANLFEIAKTYREDSIGLIFASNMIRMFDTGIEDIQIKSFINEKNNEIFYPVFVHSSSAGVKELQYSAQSSGVQALYKYMLLYYYKLLAGGVLALDEFDINLHPDILPHLVALFTDSKSNPHSAQLLFTTHNSDIMDAMTKYRTYLFEKEDGESFCYRLDELESNIIRNDRSIKKLYEQGKLGGVPRI